MLVTPSEVLAVDGFVGASGNSHHVKKDVGFADGRLYMCQPCRPFATCEWLVQRSFLTIHADIYQGNLLSVVERHFQKMSWYVDAPEPQCVRNFTAVRDRELNLCRGAVAKSRMNQCPEFDGAVRSQCCRFESL